MDLETLLSPISVPVFLNQYFGQRFLRVPGTPQKFSGLDGDRAAALEVLARDLERDFEAPVRFHPPERSTLHRCERDALLLQIGGQAGCKIHGNADERADPVWEGMLDPGDALYVPRGWWLDAAPGGQQVVFDIDNPTGADLLEWLVEHVKRQPAFESDLPRFAAPAAKADYVTGLRKSLGQYFRRPGLLEGFRRETNFKAAPRDAAGEPWSAATPGDHSIAFLTPRKIRIKRADGGTILLVAMGKRLTFPEDAAPLLHYLSDRAPVPVDEFYHAFEADYDRAELSDFLSALSKDGIIGVRMPGSI